MEAEGEAAVGYIPGRGLDRGPDKGRDGADVLLRGNKGWEDGVNMAEGCDGRKGSRSLACVVGKAEPDGSGCARCARCEDEDYCKSVVVGHGGAKESGRNGDRESSCGGVSRSMALGCDSDGGWESGGIFLGSGLDV